MLSSLQIENVAVIQKANVHFEKGLNVLTGETGAGKSILIDSINAILGNRTSKDLVRTGAAKAVIRAAFEDVPPAVLDSLEKAGYERSEALLLSREITAEGKSTCRINGMPATAAVLRELCGGLININGQHDSVGLLNPARHEGILDAYAQNSAEYQAYYAIYRELVSQLTIDDFLASSGDGICNISRNQSQFKVCFRGSPFYHGQSLHVIRKHSDRVITDTSKVLDSSQSLNAIIRIHWHLFVA